jgi:hypothetical protein
MHEALFSLFHSDFGISYIRLRTTSQVNSKGKVVKAPLVVHKYNQTMGGVDLGDQLISQYDHHFRSAKYIWKKI